MRQRRSSETRCVTCAKQVYVMPDPGLNGAAIGGDAIAEVCIRKPSGKHYRGPARPSKRGLTYNSAQWGCRARTEYCSL
jgi:hypothetical protein